MSQNSSSFSERIAVVIETLGGPVQAASKIGTTITSLQRWKNGTEPSRKFIEQIADASGFSVVWLVTGKGSLFDENKPKQWEIPEEFSERIDEIVNKIGGIEKTSTITKINLADFKNWKKGLIEPTLSQLNALAQAGNVSIDWILTGKNIKGDNEKYLNNSDEYTYIPVYDVEVSAGHGAFANEVAIPSRRLAFRQRWINARNLDPNKLSAIYARGDSMEPTIKNGAVVIVDHRKNNAVDGGIYAIRIDNRLWIKRCQWLTNGGLRLISDNPMYQSLDIPKKDLEMENNVEIIGKIIHTSYDLPD